MLELKGGGEVLPPLIGSSPLTSPLRVDAITARWYFYLFFIIQIIGSVTSLLALMSVCWSVCWAVGLYVGRSVYHNIKKKLIFLGPSFFACNLPRIEWTLGDSLKIAYITYPKEASSSDVIALLLGISNHCFSMLSLVTIHLSYIALVFTSVLLEPLFQLLNKAHQLPPWNELWG